MTTQDTTHECPAPTCETRVPQSQLACRHHSDRVTGIPRASFPTCSATAGDPPADATGRMGCLGRWPRPRHTRAPVRYGRGCAAPREARSVTRATIRAQASY
jgi:hypothetical protein